MIGAVTKSKRVGLKAPPESVEFRGLFKVRLVLDEHERRRILPSEIADVLGVDRQATHRRMLRAGLGKGVAMMTLPSARGEQDTVTLDLKYLPALLLTVQSTRVKPELRPRIEEIQQDLYDALAAYTFEGVAVNKAFAPPAKALPAPKPRVAVTATPSPSPAAGGAVTATPSTPTAEQRLAAVQLLVSDALASGRAQEARDMLDAFVRLTQPAGATLVVPDAKRLEAPLQTTEEIKVRVLAFLRERNAKGEGPLLRDVRANVPAMPDRAAREEAREYLVDIMGDTRQIREALGRRRTGT